MFNGDIQYEHNTESFYEMDNMDDPNMSGTYVGSPASLLYTPFYVDPTSNERLAMGNSNLYMHDRNLIRFGYNDDPMLPQVEQVNGTYKLNDEYVAQQKERREQIGKQEDGPDPRLLVCALQPMFDSIKVAGSYYKVAQSEFGKWYTVDPTTGNDPETFYGWPLRKNQYLNGKLSEVRNNAGANFYFIRLPDIYLMYAEILKSSNPGLALEYINKVHRRAYGYNPNSSSLVDYTSLTDRIKTSSDDHLANNPLLYERWAEFFGEAKWWEDVKRLRLGDEEAAFYKSVAGGRNIAWRDENYAMPIPPTEFESNNKMIQNPGY